MTTGREVSDEPAWRARTRGESRWAASSALIVAAAAQAALPTDYPSVLRWGSPVLIAVLLVISLVVNPNRIDAHSTTFRALSLATLAALALVNAVTLAIMIDRLVGGIDVAAGPLLRAGLAVWITNTIVFGLAYWEFDRGGPGRRSEGIAEYPDFSFPQMQDPDLAPKDWEPEFVDYLYVSFTNATAFSPTDTMPMTRWAKLMMLVQSVISLLTVALVIARAVNVFGR